MAITPDTGDAFIREVDDEYRRERLGQFWARYGRWLLAGIGLALLLLAGGLYWRSLQEQQADARGQALLRAQAGGGAPSARAALKPIESAPEPGYRALARLAEAASLIKANDLKGAAKVYEALAADSDAAEPFRNLALVRAVQLQFDDMPAQAVVDRLRPLALPGGPWFGSAGELTAMAYLKLGKSDLALPLMENLLTDEGVPTTIKARVQQLMSAMAPERLAALAQRLQQRAAAKPVGAAK